MLVSSGQELVSSVSYSLTSVYPNLPVELLLSSICFSNEKRQQGNLLRLMWMSLRKLGVGKD